jgi:hypothetical protein
VPVTDPVLSQINPTVTSHPGHKTAFIPDKYGVVADLSVSTDIDIA